MGAQGPDATQDLLAGATPPSGAHWFGTDSSGRDYFARVLYAGQISLKIGLAVALMSTVVGTVVGAAGRATSGGGSTSC